MTMIKDLLIDLQLQTVEVAHDNNASTVEQIKQLGKILEEFEKQIQERIKVK